MVIYHLEFFKLIITVSVDVIFKSKLHRWDIAPIGFTVEHRLNMKISTIYLGSSVQLYSLAETPQLHPSPAFGLIYEGAIGQPR